MLKPSLSQGLFRRIREPALARNLGKEVKDIGTPSHVSQILEQRKPIERAVLKLRKKGTKYQREKNYETYIKTGVPGLDELFTDGIPKGASTLISGGAGTGKTILCLQILAHHASMGKSCYYMSFEESEDKLIKHMKDFGWNPDRLLREGKLKIKRLSPFDVTRSIDAMVAKLKGELLIDLDPVILPRGFKPDFIVVDSLTSVASALAGKEDTYRIYIEQLFRFFEKIGSTSFLVSETKQMPEIFSTTGVEEFLADGVIVLYNLKSKDTKQNAIEVLKMRGEKHQKSIFSMNITSKGIVVYPQKQIKVKIDSN